KKGLSSVGAVMFTGYAARNASRFSPDTSRLRSGSLAPRGLRRVSNWSRFAAASNRSRSPAAIGVRLMSRVPTPTASPAGPGGRRGPRIDQRHLDEIVPVRAAGQKAAGLVVHELHTRVAVEMSAELTKRPIERLDDLFVDLHPRHRRRAERQAGQNVSAAAG